MRSLLQKFGIAVPAAPYRVIDITDPGKDLDDEQKFVLLAALQRAGMVDVVAVVANLEPPLLRARLAKGTFRALGYPHIPVGVGSDCFKGGQNLKHETDVPYLADTSAVAAYGGRLLVQKLREAADRSIILLLNSGLTDAATLVREEPKLVTQKLAGVTIMGGVQTLDAMTPRRVDGLLVPDDAVNNALDAEASEFLYRRLQELGIPMTVIMRSACYAAQFPIRLYDEFAATGHPVGMGLQSRQQHSIQQLWQAALAPEGSPVRGKLPMGRNRAQFVTVFCGGRDPGIGADDAIWPFVDSYNQYDPMAVVAAIPELRDRFFECTEVEVRGTMHRMIGCTAEANGVKDKDALIAFMSQMELAALTVVDER